MTGVLPADVPGGGTISANGVTTTVAADRTWSVDIPQAASGYVTPVEAIYTPPSGPSHRQRTAVVHGPTGRRRASSSPDGVGMRFTNTGLTGLGPVIKSLAGGAFDIGGLLLAQNPIIHQQDAFLDHRHHRQRLRGRHRRRRASPPQSTDGRRRARNITIDDLYVGREPAHHRRPRHQHRLRARAADPDHHDRRQRSTSSPPRRDPVKVDVNLVGAPTVNTGTVNYEFISGICDGDTFLIGDIVNAIAGRQIQALIGDGFATNLGDPDGAGPADSPIADAIETALGEISIAGSVGDAIQAPTSTRRSRRSTRRPTAIDFRADADFFATLGGTGPTDCRAGPVRPTSPPPSTCPAPTRRSAPPRRAAQPYGLGLVISASAFNQLLGTMTECGILNQYDHRDRPRWRRAAADHVVAARRARARVRHHAAGRHADAGRAAPDGGAVPHQRAGPER